MSIVFRPDPRVFRGEQPLVIVFGAYRPADAESLRPSDEDTITRGVAFARQIGAPLAFCQPRIQYNCMEMGRWLPSSRPKVTDRVFELSGASLFENREFVNVVDNLYCRRIVTIGPKDDSSMRATVSAAGSLCGEIAVLVADHPLQKCSTPHGFGPDVFQPSRYSGRHREISVSSWVSRTLPRQYSA